MGKLIGCFVAFVLPIYLLIAAIFDSVTVKPDTGKELLILGVLIVLSLPAALGWKRPGEYDPHA